ncbi:MAG: hypothetical protein ACOX0N_05830 [Syntrophomonadaceae bacterium]
MPEIQVEATAYGLGDKDLEISQSPADY